MSNRDNRHYVPICFGLVVLTLLLFLRVGGFEFLNYDDPDYVLNNGPVNSGLNVRSAAWAMTSGYDGHWHPVTWMSHMLDHDLFGLNPAGPHLVNLFFHISNTILLFLVFGRMTRNTWASAFVAALFAWHPLHVEPVAWVSSRKDVLSAFFMLLSLGAYVRYVEKPRKGPFILALVFFELGLMSKAMLVTLPCVLLLLDFWPLRRMPGAGPGGAPVSWKKLLFEKVPFVVLAGLSSIAAYWAEHGSGLVNATAFLPLQARISNALVSYIRYLGKTVWPQDLSAMYPYPEGWALWQVGASVLLLAFVSVLVPWQRKERPWLLVGWFWFLGTFVPVVGVILTGLHAMADRYTYIPLIGIFVMAAWSLWDFANRKPALNFPVRAATAAVLIGCFLVSWRQLGNWKNSVELFTHVTAITQNNIRAEYNLGEALAKAGRTDDAISHYRKAFGMTPNPLEKHFNYQAEAHYNLGVIFGGRGDMEGAEREFRAAIAVKPEFWSAHHNLGSVLRYFGKLDGAVEHYRIAVKGSPDDMLMMHNLALALAEQGKFAEARTNYEEVLRRSPRDVAARNDLGLALAGEGKVPDAVSSFGAALLLRPDFSEAQLNWGNALADSGQWAEARGHFDAARAIEPGLQQRLIQEAEPLMAHGRLNAASRQLKSAFRLGPDSGGLRQRLGTVLLRQGKSAEAVEHLKVAVQLSPGDYDANYWLAVAFSLSGQTKESIEQYHASLRIKSEALEAMNDLAWLLATTAQAGFRNGTEAIKLAERTCELTQRKEARYLGTLDAAYAEAGRFEDAIRTAEETRKVAVSGGQADVAEAATKRLELYRMGRSYVQ